MFTIITTKCRRETPTGLFFRHIEQFVCSIEVISNRRIKMKFKQKFLDYSYELMVQLPSTLWCKDNVLFIMFESIAFIKTGY